MPITRHGYDVPGEDVADHIMRDALVLPAPPRTDD
jgi:hypothetical protein